MLNLGTIRKILQRLTKRRNKNVFMRKLRGINYTDDPGPH